MLVRNARSIFDRAFRVDGRAMLTQQMIKQIETAIALIIDECGHGEIVLPIVKGHLCDYIERRPTIRMAVARDVGPPTGRAIEYQTKTG